MAVPRIDVTAEPAADGWACLVRIGDGPGATRHQVTVDRSTLARLAPGAVDPIEVVRASFEFLLTRETRDSILGSFDLPVIGRYFPDYETSIRARFRG